MGVKEYAMSELICHQLDCYDVEGQILPMPIITSGLTRVEAKQALQRELAREENLLALAPE